MSAARPLSEAMDACPPVVRLSPWPEGGEELENAIAKLRRVVIFLEDAERASEVGKLAAALVERYAPAAPADVKDEAVIRFAGYIVAICQFRGDSQGWRRASFHRISDEPCGHVSELWRAGDSHSLENKTGWGYRMSARIPAIEWRGGAVEKTGNAAVHRRGH